MNERKAKKLRIHRWKDIRARHRSGEAIGRVDRKVGKALLELDLKALRELLHMTQEELARTAGMTQPQISRMEKGTDARLSTLRALVAALGGKLELRATFGDKSVRLHGTG